MNTKREILKDALEISIYAHKISRDEAIEIFDCGDFDFEQITEKIKNSSKLINYQEARGLILEILTILEENPEFIVDKYKYTGFYWNGVPIFRVELKNESVTKQDKELHISLHRYKTKKKLIYSEESTQKLLMFGIGGSLLLGSIVAFYTIFKKNDN